MNTGKVVIGVLAGVAVGALLGVLFAPAKGSETRKKIARMGADTMDDLQGDVEGLLSNVNEKFDSAKINQKVDNYKDKVDEIKKEVKAQIM